MKETKRMMRRRLELQEDMIRTLEEQVVLMGDVAKIKDLTIQSIIGAMGAKVAPEQIEEIVMPPDGHKPGQYL